MDKNMDRPIEDMRLAQIGFLVNDIEKTKKEFARFFGAVNDSLTPCFYNDRNT